MSDLPLGQLIGAEQQRDAIHIAVAPVVAAETLYPGQHIGFVEGSTEQVAAIADGPRGLQNKPAIGIVDPFLTVRVLKGERCWMFLYPQTITSLRHDWTHPAFQPAVINHTAHKDKSIAWLKAQADRMRIHYDGLMEAADRWVRMEDHTIQDDSETWRDTPPESMAEFWHHYEIVTGKKPENADQWFFCCTC